MTADVLFDGLLLIAMTTGPILLAAFVADAIDAFRG